LEDLTLNNRADNEDTGFKEKLRREKYFVKNPEEDYLETED
jgi:hypothetical protein